MKEKEPQAQRYNIQQRHTTHTTTHTANIPNLAAIITTETTSNPNTPGLRVKKTPEEISRIRIRVPPGRALDWEPGEVGDARCRDWRSSHRAIEPDDFFAWGEIRRPKNKNSKRPPKTKHETTFLLFPVGFHWQARNNLETDWKAKFKSGNPATKPTETGKPSH